MGVAGQIGVAGLLRPVQQHLLEGHDPAGGGGQLAFGEKAKIGGDLIVATAPGMETGAHRAGDLGDPTLDGGMDVLVAFLEDKTAVVELFPHPRERSLQDGGVVLRNQPGPGQAPHVGHRAPQVVGRQPPVVGDADAKGQELIGRLLGAEPALPERHGWSAA